MASTVASSSTPSGSGSAAGPLLQRQLRQMQTSSIPGISAGLSGDDIFEWEVMLMISDDVKYYGGK
jgi:ubiquitin-conjugating enzyme E2 G1